MLTAHTQPPLTSTQHSSLAACTAGQAAHSDQIDVSTITSYAAWGQQLIVGRVGGIRRTYDLILGEFENY